MSECKKKLEMLSVKELIEDFRRVCPLPFEGVLTGQSVSSYIAYKLGLRPSFEFKDVDVFMDESTSEVPTEDSPEIAGTIPAANTAQGFQTGVIPLTQGVNVDSGEDSLKAALSRESMDTDYEDMVNDSGYSIKTIYEHEKLQVVVLCGQYYRAELDDDLTFSSAPARPEAAPTLLVPSSPEADAALADLAAFCHQHIIPTIKVEDDAVLIDRAFNWMILQSFDLNIVQVGVDLRTGELLYTAGFVHYLDTLQIVPVRGATSFRTLYRLLKKEAEGLGFVSDKDKGTLSGIVNVEAVQSIHRWAEKVAFKSITIDTKSMESVTPSFLEFVRYGTGLAAQHLVHPGAVNSVESSISREEWLRLPYTAPTFPEKHSNKRFSALSIVDALSCMKLGWLRLTTSDDLSKARRSYDLTIVPLTAENLTDYLATKESLPDTASGLNLLVVLDVEARHYYQLTLLESLANLVPLTTRMALRNDGYNTKMWPRLIEPVKSNLLKDNSSALIASSKRHAEARRAIIHSLCQYLGMLKEDRMDFGSFSEDSITEQGYQLIAIAAGVSAVLDPTTQVTSATGMYSWWRDHALLMLLSEMHLNHYSCPLRFKLLAGPYCDQGSPVFYPDANAHPLLFATVYDDYYHTFLGFNRNAFKQVTSRSALLAQFMEHREMDQYVSSGVSLEQLACLIQKTKHYLGSLGPTGEGLSDSVLSLLSGLGPVLYSCVEEPDAIMDAIKHWANVELHNQILTTNVIPLPPLDGALDLLTDDQVVSLAKTSAKEGREALSAMLSGYKVTELVTLTDLRREGAKMQHCVGGYGHSIRSNRCRILSIQGPLPEDRATAEWRIRLKNEATRTGVLKLRAKVTTQQLKAIQNTAPSPTTKLVTEVLALALASSESFQAWAASAMPSFEIDFR